MHALKSFLFPCENSDTTGRLELFAEYGPTDEQGLLRGGVQGAHAHTASEIRLMIQQNCRAALLAQFEKPRSSSVDNVVESLLPAALAQRYTWADVQRILRGVQQRNGRMDFSEVQRAIFASQAQRLQGLLARAKGGQPISPPTERSPKVPYQSKSAAQMMAFSRKKQFTSGESAILEAARLSRSCMHIASLEDQRQVSQLRANSLLIRGPGSVDDRWDRYCARRRTGRGSYVKARNTERFNPSMDEGLADKHPSCSCLVAASASGSSAAAALGAF